MNFVCDKCKQGKHCDDQGRWCDCQHRTRPKVA